MLEEALAALASTGGGGPRHRYGDRQLGGIKARFACVIGRGHTAEMEAVEARLEQSRAALEGLTGQDLERARAEQEIVWRTRLSDLLERDPSLEPELRALVTETQAHMIGAAGRIEQHVAAFDQAQQAVQGQGVQNVTFGEHHGPGIAKG